MAVDLHQRASDQRDALAAVVTEVNDALAAARADLTARHPDPGSLARTAWVTDLGAAQHVDVARAALAALQDTEQGIRAELAAIVNPADAQTFEGRLRDNLIEQAELRVELRSATERKEGATDLVARLAALAADGARDLAAADDEVLWGKERDEHTTAIINLLNAAPLDTAPAVAAGVLAGTGFAAAATRLDTLVPAALLARAETRAAEAATLVTSAATHAATTEAAVAALDGAARPTASAITVTRSAYQRAEDALTAYVRSTPALIDRAPGTLAAVAAQPDLSPAQVTVLQPADPSDIEAALAREDDLAQALTQLAAARRAVDDARLGVLVGDAGADPAGAETALADVEANVVAPARAAYDAATRAAVDRWEVEVPPALWLAVRDFVEVRAALEAVADADTVTDLIAAVDLAEDDLGQALDQRDGAVRQRLSVRLLDAHRQSRAAAARSTVNDRLVHYVRGDGPSGRTSAEL